MQRALALGIGDPQRAMAGFVRGEADETRRPVPGQPRQAVQSGFQRLAEVARHHHLAERGTAVVLRLQPDPTEISLPADVDAADRPVGRAQLLHHPQRGQRIDRRRRETEVALVEHRRHLPGRRRFHQPHLHALARQGDGKTGTHQPTAHDHYVMPICHADMIAPALRPPTGRLR